MQFLEISWDFGILGFSKILGFFQRYFGIFDEVYEDFQSNLPLGKEVTAGRNRAPGRLLCSGSTRIPVTQNKKVQQKCNLSRFLYCFTSTKILTRSRHPG